MSRRQARELALQVLFHVDVGRSDPDTALFQAFARELEEGAGEPLSEKDATYARDLVLGTWERKDDLDVIIAKYAKDWALERLAGVDRAILRLAIYEIKHQEDVPDGVVADEAVELAKSFSTAESGKFINGILGSVIRGLEQGTASVETLSRD
ncbi:MAG TPA: transcription antitermination factor NusB [Symbiobacteriaceae bacterium]|nr:transcription antitermination factor NusB [Symbiobacteriaceae bacterium]